MTEKLKTSLNEICSYLAEGEAWHRRMANQCRKIHVRGWGRWHDVESLNDGKSRSCLEKLLEDILHFEPTINVNLLVDAESAVLNNTTAEFKQHHAQWLNREDRLIKSLNAAVDEIRTISMDLYNKLYSILCEVQNEYMRVEMLIGRLDLASWGGHDIGICSMILHKYFECEYDGGLIDFNVG